MGRFEACLVNAYNTIVRTDFAAHRNELPALTARTRELLLATARLYDDAMPFLRELRSRGVKVAIVSNCDENTRPMLAASGVAALADALILSCEVGAEKPEAAIYQQALGRLGMAVVRSLAEVATAFSDVTGVTGRNRA